MARKGGNCFRGQCPVPKTGAPRGTCIGCPRPIVTDPLDALRPFALASIDARVSSWSRWATDAPSSAPFD